MGYTLKPSCWIYLGFLFLQFSVRDGYGIAETRQGDHPNGVWTYWSFWTACSRTCGTGVTSRTRYCKDGENLVDIRNCLGSHKEYAICNKQPCPHEADDFRMVQCSVYNEIDRFGVEHEWLPVREGECNLVCRMQEKSTTEIFGFVMDGTRCNKGICVQGSCLRMGCDYRLGSELETDACGVCGGFNTTCGKFSGTFTIDVNEEELFHYYDVVTFPVGSFNISVQDHSNVNYLAMTVNNVPRLNAFWYIDRPGPYTVAGTIFYYDRNKMGHERLHSRGPILHPVEIKMIVREKPKVYYEFNVPTAAERRRIEEEYQSMLNANPSHPPLVEEVQQPPRATPTPYEIQTHQPIIKQNRNDDLASFLHPHTAYQVMPENSNSIPSNNEHNPSKHIKPREDQHGNKIDSPGIVAQPGRKDGYTHHPGQRPPKKSKKSKPKKLSRKELRERCPPCKKVKGKLKSFCYSDFVLHVDVINRELINNMTRYDVRIIETFRNTITLFPREFMWVPNICNCPRIRSGYNYLIMGNRVQVIATRENHLFIGDKNMVRKWKDNMRDPWEKLHITAHNKCWKFDKRNRKSNG